MWEISEEMIAYQSVSELVSIAQKERTTIGKICIADQAKLLQTSEEVIMKQMEQNFDVMLESAAWGQKAGRRSVSGLTGDEGSRMIAYRAGGNTLMGPMMTSAMGIALAVSNCNAAMGKIVASPTAGSCGILPGCLIPMYQDRGVEKERIVQSMFTAGAFGMVIASNACVAGAEGGCQAECGSAAGMAGAALVELQGGTPEQCSDALAIALVSQMGLVCDPVAGLVEIPCTKRNASGVAIAFASADMALAGIRAKIPADECIAAMKEVGDAMSRSLKETAEGGLAATPTGKELRKQIMGEGI